MKYSDLKSSILTQFAQPSGNRFVPFILGRPGGGKSTLAREIAQELSKIHRIPAHRIIEFNPSLREPTDILGLPQIDGDHARWLPPEEFYAIRKGVGPSVLIMEELSDAQMDMQNPLCRVILDRHAGQMPLTEELFIIATGNRTEDRSGASRLSTKLSNRTRILNFTENVDDWIVWASANGISAALTSFMRYRPDLLSAFDPNKSCNPTPRSWEDVSRIPTTLTTDVYFEHVCGCVGEGAASEYTGYLRLFESITPFEQIVANPKGVPVPDSPDKQYAAVGQVLSNLTPENVEAVTDYLERFPKEFMVIYMRDALTRYKWLTGKKIQRFLDFAARNAHLFH